MEQIAKKSKIVRIITILIISLVIYFLFFRCRDEPNNQTISGEIESTIIQNQTSKDNTLNNIIDRIYSSPLSFISKLFIFFGIIYLIQIFFSASFDIIEIFLIIFVLIKRGVKSISTKKLK